MQEIEIPRSDFSRDMVLEMFVLPMLATIDLLVGFAVIKAFKKNHPLARRDASQFLESDDDDFLEQNKAIASELFKIDERLNKWPYLLYKLWLRFALVVETMLIIYYGITQLGTKRLEMGIRVAEFIAFSFPYFLDAYCSYGVEVVFRTKMLERSKRAILQLKICLVVSTIMLVVLSLLASSGSLRFSFLFSLKNSFIGFTLVPLIALVGALKVNTVIEERDHFV